MKNIEKFITSTIEDGGSIINILTGDEPDIDYIILNEGNEKTFPLFGNYIINEILISGAIKLYLKENQVENKFLVSFIKNNLLYLRICDIHTHLV